MSTHEKWLQEAKKYQAELLTKTGQHFKIPPPSLSELKMEYLEIEPGSRMLGLLPFQERFTNPVGIYQGGMLGAALDEVFGPLSYLTANRPCMTLSMNLTFVKAFTPELKEVLVEGFVLHKTKNLIFMRGEIKSRQGDLLAHGESHVTILRDDQLSKVKV